MSKVVGCMVAVAMLLVCSAANAQSKRQIERRLAKQQAEYSAYAAQIVAQYSDSLTKWSEERGVRSEESDVLRDPYYYRLFLPGTFYSSVTGNLFELYADKEADEVGLGLGESPLLEARRRVERQNELLSRIYTKQPELIGYSDAAYADEKPLIEGLETPIEENLQIASKVDADEIEDIAEVVEVEARKPNWWTLSQTYTLQLLQNYFSDNWYAGGNSNYSFLGTAVIKLNYDNQQKVTFENTLDMKLGFQTTTGDSIHDLTPTSDQIRLTNKFNVQATGSWYYSLQLVSTTQFVRHYSTNSPTVNSDILSPFESVLSLGMDYKHNGKKLQYSLNLAPLALDYKYVKRTHLRSDNGIDDGKTFYVTYGSTITLTYTWQLLDEMKWTGRLYYFTSYEKVQVEWENTFTFTINKYLTTNLYLYPRFDDTESDDEGRHRLQFKEYLSFGLSYSF